MRGPLNEYVSHGGISPKGIWDQRTTVSGSAPGMRCFISCSIEASERALGFLTAKAGGVAGESWMGASPPLPRHLLLVRPKDDVSSAGRLYEGLKTEAMGCSDLGDVVLDNISLIGKFHAALLTACLQHIDIKPLNVIQKSRKRK